MTSLAARSGILVEARCADNRRARPDAKTHPRPDEVLLLVEVADRSLPFDRGIKLPLYAAAGIPELWTVDLATNAVEVHREPGDRSFAVGERFTEGSISPVALPDLQVQVGAILPPAA